MALSRGKAIYKKKDGILSITDDQKAVTWAPLPGTGSAVVSLAIQNITSEWPAHPVSAPSNDKLIDLPDLQQTPDSSPKVMLKIFEKVPNSQGEPVPYLFQFSSTTDARTEANAVKDLLSRLISEVRTNDPNLPRPAAGSGAAVATDGSGGASAAMSFASAANAKPAAARWFSDSELKADIELQQSLLKEKDQTELRTTYMDARAAKPDSISDAVFNSQFWSTRTSLLRAHAIEINQKKGTYNVLSTVKPRTVDGELKLDMKLEQVQMILEQHPLVKRIYNDTVPKKLSESEFWSRFFLSKLSKKLRGERVSENDNPDAIFDKYKEEENTMAFTSKIMSQQVPHYIDLEGNEENQGGFKSGNRKDVEMRPRSNIPIVRTLNSLSEKIMENVAPSDPGATVATVDEETYDELALRDLRGDAQENRIILNVKEQSRFFSNQKSAPSADAQLYEKQVPSEVLFDVQSDLDTLQEDGAGGIDLHAGIGVDEESDSDEETVKKPYVGVRASWMAVQKQVLEGVAQRRAETYGNTSDEGTPMDIPADIAQRAFLTNATTMEFLKQFWGAFLSGDPERAQELAYHAESLKNSAVRIEAIADEAEAARDKIIEQRKKDIYAHFKKTGKKIRWKAEWVGGGRQAVLVLLEPTMDALRTAQNMYQGALQAEGIQPSTE